MQTISKVVKEQETVSEILTAQSGCFDVVVHQNAAFNVCFLQTGQDLKVRVLLSGQNAKCFIKVVYLSSTDYNNHIELEVIHQVPETFSNQEVKGVLTGAGKADFYGVIRIPHASQKCEGSQMHKALLVSDDAKVKCTPELEIYADDVKCNHGSSIGTLDETSLFYLTSRGIERALARKMLIKAFLMAEMPSAFEPKINEWMADDDKR